MDFNLINIKKQLLINHFSVDKKCSPDGSQSDIEKIKVRNLKFYNNSINIMTELLVQLRQGTNSLPSVLVTAETSVKQFKQLASHALGVPANSFVMYKDEYRLDSTSNIKTLEELSIHSNAIIDIQYINPVEVDNNITLILQYGMDRTKIQFSVFEKIYNVKAKVQDMLSCSSSDFDLIVGDLFLGVESSTIVDYNLQNNAVVSIKRKIPMSGLGNELSSKIKLAESVVSSSQHIQDRQQDDNDNYDQSPISKRQINIQKKSSCSASLRNIKDQADLQRRKKDQMKHSSIQPYTMQKNQVDQVQQKQNRMTRIQDIKQTMSFGSLQESKPQEIQVEVQNQQLNMYYRFSCPFGCRVTNLKTKLAKAERVELQKLQILQVDEQSLIEDLGVIGELINLKFKVTI